MKTKKEADKDTLSAIGRAEAQIKKLRASRTKASGRELKEIDSQITQHQNTVSILKRSMR